MHEAARSDREVFFLWNETGRLQSDPALSFAGDAACRPVYSGESAGRGKLRNYLYWLGQPVADSGGDQRIFSERNGQSGCHLRTWK